MSSASAMVYLQAMGVICAPARDRFELAAALRREDGPQGLRVSEDYSPGRPLPLGEVASIRTPLAAPDPAHRSRNNALLDAALTQLQPQLREQIGRVRGDRIGVAIGSSTAGIAEGEEAIVSWRRHARMPPAFHFGQQELVSAARFVASRIGAAGPVATLSTACSSAAKALASGARWLRAGLCDLVLAGGADSLCRFTVAGFSALEAISRSPCNPFSRHRDGINIGEGAALFLMSREAAAVRLSGWGETSDAHHVSAPLPDGRGAEAAMREALARAGLNAADIDYVNLHGTATALNDLSESLAVHRIFGERVWCSSSKPLTGHALGAAGAIEAAICYALLHPETADGHLPVHWWDGCVDPQLAPLRLVPPGLRLPRRPRHLLSNSFAFGGSNASLLLSAD